MLEFPDEVKNLAKAEIKPQSAPYDLEDNFYDYLEGVIENAKQNGTSGAYLTFAIDNLCSIISWYNVEFADALMQKLLTAIEEELGQNHVTYQLNLDHFAIVLPESTEEETLAILHKINDVISEFETPEFKKPMHVLASFGVVDFPATATNARDAFYKSYIALNDAKNPSKLFYANYKNITQEESEEESPARMAHYIQDVIENNKFRTAYQPVVSSKTGHVEFYESLLRVEASPGKYTTASALIPLAEKMNFIKMIDRIMLENAVLELRQFPNLKLSFNISNLTTDDADWLKMCTKLLNHYELASRIIVEITETAAQRDLRQTAYFVASLQGLGCQVALDDFGAGYTSFRQLKLLSVDMIKIDGAFIRDLVNNSDNRLFVKTLLDFTSSYGLKTIAEFVETGDVAKILIDMNIDFLQGYYFGEPKVERAWAPAAA